MDEENKRVGKWMPHWVDGGCFNNQNIYGYNCSECNYWIEKWLPNLPKNCLYRSKNDTIINADVNGSANIMRKCKQNLDYEKLCNGLLASPKRIRLS